MANKLTFKGQTLMKKDFHVHQEIWESLVGMSINPDREKEMETWFKLLEYSKQLAAHLVEELGANAFVYQLGYRFIEIRVMYNLSEYTYPFSISVQLEHEKTGKVVVSPSFNHIIYSKPPYDRLCESQGSPVITYSLFSDPLPKLQSTLKVSPKRMAKRVKDELWEDMISKMKEANQKLAEFHVGEIDVKRFCTILEEKGFEIRWIDHEKRFVGQLKTKYGTVNAYIDRNGVEFALPFKLNAHGIDTLLKGLH